MRSIEPTEVPPILLNDQHGASLYMIGTGNVRRRRVFDVSQRRQGRRSCANARHGRARGVREPRRSGALDLPLAGQLQDDTETLAVIKTTRERFEMMKARLVELHPYEVAEVIALPVEAGHAPYLEWVAAQVQPRKS